MADEPKRTPIEATCPNGHTFRVKRKYAGKAGKCPECSARTLVPESARDTQADASPALKDTLETSNSAELGALAPKGKNNRPPRFREHPDSIDRFQIERVIGEGAFGTVYLAHDPQLKREVALKAPRRAALGDASGAEKFLREARAAAALRHPNIVPVFDAGEADGAYYIASAYIPPGRTMGDKLREEGRVEPEEAARLIERLALALDYAHEAGVIHRDIKPDNVLLDEAGLPHLADFGLARHSELAEGEAKKRVRMGTPAYMSPEQHAGHSDDADGRTDQWSLGVMLYEMLAGTRPFEGNAIQLAYAVKDTDPDPIRNHNPSAPRDLETICRKCMEKDPADRYATCGDLAADLVRWREQRPIQARKVRIAERLWLWSKRNPSTARLSTSIVVILLAIFVAIVWQWQWSTGVLNKLAEAAGSLEQLEQLPGELDAAKTEIERLGSAVRQAEADADQKVKEVESAKTALQAELDEKIQELNAVSVASEAWPGYVSDLRQVRLLLEENDPVAARQLLESIDAKFHDTFEWRFLNRWAQRPVLRAADLAAPATPRCVSSDERFVICDTSGGTIAYDLELRRTVHTFGARLDGPMAFAPNGPYFAHRGTIYKTGWDADGKWEQAWTVQEVLAANKIGGANWQARVDPRFFVSVAFSADGQRFITMGGRVVHQFYTRGGQGISEHVLPDEIAQRDASLAPNGARLAVAMPSKTAIYEFETWNPLVEIPALGTVSWDATGDSIIVGGRVFEADSGESVFALPTQVPGPFPGALSGRTVWTASRHGFQQTQIESQPLEVIPGHSRLFMHEGEPAALAKNGQEKLGIVELGNREFTLLPDADERHLERPHLIAGSQLQRIYESERYVRIIPGRREDSQILHGKHVMAIGPQRRRLAWGGEDKLTVWDAVEQEFVASVDIAAKPKMLAWNAAGDEILLVQGGQLRRYSATDLKLKTEFKLPESVRPAYRVASCGSLELAVLGGRAATVLNAETGEVRLAMSPRTGQVWKDLAATPDGNRLALRDQRGRISIRDARFGDELVSIDTEAGLGPLLFNSKGDVLYTAAPNGVIALQAPTKGALLARNTETSSDRTDEGIESADAEYAKQLEQARKMIAAGKAREAFEALDVCSRPQRGWEWHYLRRQAIGDGLLIRMPSTVSYLDLSPTGEKLVAHGILADLADFKTRLLRGHQPLQSDATFIWSSDEERVAAFQRHADLETKFQGLLFPHAPASGSLTRGEWARGKAKPTLVRWQGRLVQASAWRSDGVRDLSFWSNDLLLRLDAISSRATVSLPGNSSTAPLWNLIENGKYRVVSVGPGGRFMAVSAVPGPRNKGRFAKAFRRELQHDTGQNIEVVKVIELNSPEDMRDVARYTCNLETYKRVHESAPTSSIYWIDASHFLLRAVRLTQLRPFNCTVTYQFWDAERREPLWERKRPLTEAQAREEYHSVGLDQIIALFSRAGDADSTELAKTLVPGLTSNAWRNPVPEEALHLAVRNRAGNDARRLVSSLKIPPTSLRSIRLDSSKAAIAYDELIAVKRLKQPLASEAAELFGVKAGNAIGDLTGIGWTADTHLPVTADNRGNTITWSPLSLGGDKGLVLHPRVDATPNTAVLAAGDDSGAEVPDVIASALGDPPTAVAKDSDAEGRMAVALKSRVEIWDATGVKLLELEEKRPIVGLAFSPDGRRLAIATKGSVTMLDSTRIKVGESRKAALQQWPRPRGAKTKPPRTKSPAAQPKPGS